MATRTRARRYSGWTMARRQGRRAASSTPMRVLARAGFLARGIMYIVIGWIALLVAFHKTGQQADRTGALHELGRTPIGEVALWVLVVGFLGMTIWRLSEAVFGASGAGRPKATTRLASLGKAVIYAVIAWGVLEYAIGVGSPPSSDQQSVDLTATVMRHPGGRVAVVVIGLVFIGSGLYLGYNAWRKRFRDDLRLGQMHTRTRRIVEWLGRYGGIARGIVFVTAGVFLVVAAVKAQPGQAKGIDSALRSLAHTPLGPWLLVLVAIGLVMFGLFSCCEARWRRF
jgi:type IV secretory pathway VirB2 component (pilin)